MSAEAAIDLEFGDGVRGCLLEPEPPWAVYVLAHGAGAGMRHAFLGAMAGRLADRGVAVLRYEFPYRTQGRARPDPAEVLMATVGAALAEAARRFPALPRFAGGKSFGGRMTSTAVAGGDGRDLAGLVFLGFPLHPAGRPGTGRADHLAQVPLPMLFLQGTRDALADLALLAPVCERLGARATLHVVAGADHGFDVLRRDGRTPAAVLDELAEVACDWMRSRAGEAS